MGKRVEKDQNKLSRVNTITTLSNILRKINKRIYLLIAAIILIIIAAHFYLFKSFEKNDQALRKEHVEKTIENYFSNFTQQLILIASSSAFTDYLRSGDETRAETSIDMDLIFSKLRREEVIGFTIEKGSEVIYKNGDLGKSVLSLDLCYIGNRLNPTYGNCRYSINTFFSPTILLLKLKKLDTNIESCKLDCEKINLINHAKFNYFKVNLKSSLSIPIKYKTNHTTYKKYIFELLLILFTLFCILFITQSNKRIIHKYIIHPIQRIISDIDKGTIEVDSENLVLNELNVLKSNIVKWSQYEKEIRETRSNQEIGKIASQVVHDIRSPLATFNVIIEDIKEISDSQKDILLSATERINNIANDLLLLRKDTRTKNSHVFDFSKVIKQIIEEKKVQFDTESKVRVTVDAPINIINKNSKITKLTFERIFSNLLNNSYEAILPLAGEIKININLDNNSIRLSIWNNGKIIPEKVLAKMGKEEVTYGKKDGNGLGVLHTIHKIEQAGGVVNITSNETDKTTLKLIIPKTNSNQ
jgi:signal transduction histidine kinase